MNDGLMCRIEAVVIKPVVKVLALVNRLSWSLGGLLARSTCWSGSLA